jgi:hypothetical protein
MVDILLSSDRIDVLGGAVRSDVNIEVGPRGERGSNIFVGPGNPNLPTAVLPQTPKAYDMYINLAPDDVEYLFLYQFLNYGGSFTWVRLLRLIPSTFLENKELEFENGIAEYNVPVSIVIPLASVGAYGPLNFNIQHEIVNENPIASAVQVAEEFVIDENDSLVLPITIRASELDLQTNNWQSLSGTKIAHLVMTVI